MAVTASLDRRPRRELGDEHHIGREEGRAALAGSVLRILDRRGLAVSEAAIARFVRWPARPATAAVG